MDASSIAALFADGLDRFGEVAHAIDPSAWDRVSPCEGWTALDVLGHLSTTVEMGISVLGGTEPTWPEVARPADLVTGDPVEFWDGLATRGRAALDGADLERTMDTPMGPKTVAERLAFPAIDLFVHAWDVGHTAGTTVEVPPEVIDLSHEMIDPFPVEMVRGPNGSFGAEVEAPADATPTETFIAWTGRPPR